MAIVKFLGPIGKEDLRVDIKNLSELKSILNKDTSLKQWLGECAIALNDEMVSNLNKNIKSDDVICILPPVCGG